MKILNKKIAKSKSSAAWLLRQAHDPYVVKAQNEGYRARAVYKIIEMNEKFKFFHNGQVVVDFGAAPGSWSQYVAREYPKSKIFAMDLLEIKPIPGVEFYQGDFTTDEALHWLTVKLNLPAEGTGHGSVDVVMSDMAPNTVGHKRTDHLRQMVLLEYALDFAKRALKPGGTFIVKSFTGGETGGLIREMRMYFTAVHQVKPPSSRKDSVEMFIVALGYKG
ncbi:MAG: RlmE family RNA methyltransferase [Rickettsiales bacterium]|nr:RlmE family RNA methyltransferase [Rickettsiales bacterium]